MFEPKSTEKLRSTDNKVYQNKLTLDDLSLFDPFELVNSDGLSIFKNPDFEPYYKVINSLKVTDENGQFLFKQTECLKKDVLKAAKQNTFLELLYCPSNFGQTRYNALLEEKLMIYLVNLVLEEELPDDRTLTAAEIDLAKKTFKEMLENV